MSVMYSREQIEQHIWDYIDGSSTPAMKDMVEKLLHSDPEWNKVYLELKDFNTLVGSADLMEAPSMRFSKNVMEEVARYQVAPPTRSYINKKVVFGIGGFFVLSILALLVSGVSQIDFSQPGSHVLPTVDLKNYDVNWRQYLKSPLMYIFLFMDVIAGLLLLDRYLRRNNEKLRETA